MIELAPNHKMGLPAANPVLLAGGIIGCGDSLPRGLETASLGAVVVGPITAQSQRGVDPPRLAETVGGFVLRTGLQNRGVRAVLRACALHWPRLGCPVVAQIADVQPMAVSETASQLAEVDSLAGCELLLPPEVNAEELRRLVRAARRAAELPLWIKLPLASAAALAPVAVEAGADALVVAQPPAGALPRAGDTKIETVRGSLYGPLTFGLLFDVLLRITAMRLPVPVIACGGIHTLDGARAVLEAGAQAFQIDSAAWIEPGLPERLRMALHEQGQSR